MNKQITLLITLFGVIAGLAGCVSMKNDLSKFIPYDQTGPKERYTFIASADIFHPDGNADMEKVRMSWLQEWLDENGLCKSGYSIESRKPIKNLKLTNIYYVISCK